MSREPWSDERLHDAYAALVARPTPPGLEEDVMSELRERPARATRAWWRAAALLPAAGALTAVAVVAVALFSGSTAPVASPPAGSAGPSPSGAMASASPASSPSPGGSPAADLPSEVLGLAVITVERLLELTDEGTHAGEVLAVGGWYLAPPPMPCPAILGPPELLELRCPETFSWLSARPEDLSTVMPDGSVQIHPPSGPAVNPKFVEGTVAALPDAEIGEWVPVVFLGHVGDERATLCPAAVRSTCERTFVVDRVAWANGAGAALELYHDSGLAGMAKPSVADAESYVEATLPGATILSVAYLAGETVRRIEPHALYEGDAALYVIRVIGTRPCGQLLGDGTYGWSDPLLFTLAGDPVPHPYGPCVLTPL